MMRDGGFRAGRSYRRHLSIFICLVLIFVLSTTVAHAITIVVDGDRDDLWDGDGAGQTPGIITDPNEPDIVDNVDIKEFRWTNDKDNMYFMIEVYAAAPFMPVRYPVNICLDTDNNAATTIHSDPELDVYRDRCGDIEGIDVIIEAVREPSGLVVDIFDAKTFSEGFMGYLGAGQLGYNPGSATTPVVEISVPLDKIGFANCTGTIPMVVYYDGGDTNPDDNLPDSGTANISCGVPTAVSMHSLSTVVNSPVSSSALLAGLVLTIVSGGVMLRRERRA